VNEWKDEKKEKILVLLNMYVSFIY
jgi:hypothetical protein